MNAVYLHSVQVWRSPSLLSTSRVRFLVWALVVKCIKTHHLMILVICSSKLTTLPASQRRSVITKIYEFGFYVFFGLFFAPEKSKIACLYLCLSSFWIFYLFSLVMVCYYNWWRMSPKIIIVPAQICSSDIAVQTCIGETCYCLMLNFCGSKIIKFCSSDANRIIEVTDVQNWCILMNFSKCEIFEK